MGLAHGLPAYKWGRKTSDSAQITAYCHDTQLKNLCPQYDNVMKSCCDQAVNRSQNDDVCNGYTQSASACGGKENMFRAMSTCCALEWPKDGVTAAEFRATEGKDGIPTTTADGKELSH